MVISLSNEILVYLKASPFTFNGSAKNKEERVRAFPLLSADDLYDEEKYRELFIRATEELLGG